MKRLSVVLICVLFVVPAFAQEGGTESPLSDAQGVRALGTGGAVAAWLDDPAALWWNPATLTFVPVKRIELQHTQNAFDTRTEQFAAAFPTLDYGALAVGAAVQTTSDITITGPSSPLPLGTEKFTRFRVAAGYGFTAPYHLRFGAALKVAGYRFNSVERTAWGLDVGAVPLTRGPFKVGIAVQNLLRPTFSFGSDAEDKWPRRAILGVAAQTVQDKLILSIQAESAQQHPSRVRVGSEFSATAAVQLRAGYDGKGPAVGIGFRYGRLRADYAFLSPSDLGSEHRFGISIDLGPSLRDQRERRAARVQSQISTALEDARSRSREELTTQAEAAYAAGDWETATRTYSQLAVLFPDDASYGERLNELATRRDSMITARIARATAATADSERLAALTEMYDNQMNAREWTAAVLIADRLAALGADSADVALRRTRASDSLDVAYRRAVGRSEAALDAGRIAEAAGWAQAALLYRPADSRATGLLRRAELRSSIQKATTALSEAVAANDSAAVRARAQDLLTLEPENALAKQYLKAYRPVVPEEVVGIEQLKQDSEAWGWYTQGFVEFRAARYAEAIQLWEKVLERYPTNEDTRKNIEQARLRIDTLGGGDNR